MHVHSAEVIRVVRLGGVVACAVGVAIVGTVFFARLEDASFTNAFELALPIAAGMFVLATVLALLLPPTAVGEDEAQAEA